MIVFYINAIGRINMINMTNEEWRPIPGYEGFYSASNLGRIRSEKRIITEIRKMDDFVPKSYQIPEKILKAGIQKNNGKGYHRVSLSINSKVKYFMVHRLVMLTFIGERKEGQEIRHLDGNCRNNKLSNLTYGTKTENMYDALLHGTLPVHECRPGSKLNRWNVVEICKSGLRGECSKSIANHYGVNVGTVHQIWRGETWQEFTEGIRPKRDFRIFKYLTAEQINLLKDNSIKQCVVAKILNVQRHSVAKWRKKLIAG